MPFFPCKEPTPSSVHHVAGTRATAQVCTQKYPGLNFLYQDGLLIFAQVGACLVGVAKKRLLW